MINLQCVLNGRFVSVFYPIGVFEHKSVICVLCEPAVSIEANLWNV